MSFTPLGDAMAARHKTGPLKQQVEAGNVMTAAEEVFAVFFGDLAEHVRPQFLKNRTLTVTCSSAAMAQEIRLNQAKIVKEINKQVGETVVDRIRYLA